MGHIAPFTLRTLLYGDDNLDLTENKRIITETIRFINDSKRFAWLPRICYVSFLTVCCSLFIVNIPFIIFLLMSICISSLGPSHSVTFCPWRCATFLIPTFNSTLWVENVQSTATWHVMLCCVTLLHVVPRCATLYHDVPHVVLCCATLCHVVLYLRSLYALFGTRGNYGNSQLGIGNFLFSQWFVSGTIGWYKWVPIHFSASNPLTVKTLPL